MQIDDPRVIERYRVHAELCKVLTDPKRLMILDALRHGERSVGALAGTIGVALPNASQHLAVMRNAGLVEGRREGTTIIYRLAEPTIVDACDIVHAIADKRVAPRPVVGSPVSVDPTPQPSPR
jgi:DNA-binding transcriptional ArsR family regulator